jgi:lysophospholipase L1-like esterase
MGKTDWDVVTNYTDAVTTTLKTVTFPKVQEQVYLRNQGNANFTYTIGSQSGTLIPGQSVTVNQDVSSFTLQAVSGTHTFELRAKEKGTERIEDNSSDAMSILVDRSKFTGIIPKDGKTVLFGDSITGLNFDSPTATSSYYYYRGYFTHANVLLGHYFDVVKEAGVGGNSTTQMLARIYTDVVSFNPSWCVVLGGTNDIQNVSSSVTISNLTKIYNILVGRGIKVIACTIPPCSYMDTTVRKQFVADVNNWIKSYAVNNPNIIVVDWYNSILDSSTGLALSSMVIDGIHPSASGAYALGKSMADTLKPYIQVMDNLLIADSGSNIIKNGLMTGNTARTRNSPIFYGGDSMITAQDVFITAMSLMDEESEDGAYTGYPDEYKKKAWPILTLLQAELLPASASPSVITDNTSIFQVDDRTGLMVLPYGLAAHLLLNEDQNRAAYFNNRYDELKRKKKAVITKIKDVYGIAPSEEETPATPTPTEETPTDGGDFLYESPSVWDGGEF